MRVRRSSGILPLLLSILCVGIISGCNNPDAPFSSSSSEAPSLHKEVPDSAKNETQHLVEQFVEELQKNDYSHARDQMTPTLKAKTPATQKEWLGQGYQSLIGATEWKFDLFQYSMGEKKVVVHAGFKGTDNFPYRTNIIMVQSDKSWLIDTILPPTKQAGAKARHIGGATTTPKI